MMVSILEDYIDYYAHFSPNKVALVCGEERCTYKVLLNRIRTRINEFSKDLEKIVCLRAYSTIDFLISYFALHKMGRVAVPLEQTLPDESFMAISTHLSSCSVPDGTADILYTTGTTGRSKGVMISHKTILANAENLIDGQGFSPDLAFVVNGPLNHIGSLSKIYPVIVLGGTIIIVNGLKDINSFFDAFNYPAKKMATFLVPASIRMLLHFSAERFAEISNKVDFIETGAAPITQTDMKDLCRLLPNSRLYNTYASTETGIISTYNYNDGICLANCLGKPMKHSKIFITNEGLIACQGDTLMTGYVDDWELTNSVLRDKTIYTHDIGYLDTENMLYLTGREDDIINVGGFKVAPSEVENIARELPEVRDCICVAAVHPVIGTTLKLLILLESSYKMDKKRIARFIDSKLETYKVPLYYEEVDSIYRTYNGKLDRKKYRDIQK